MRLFLNRQRVKHFWTTSDKYLVIPVITLVISCLLIILTYAFAFTSLPQKLPLFYSLPWGQSQLVTKEQFMLLPVNLLLIALVNIFIAVHLHESQVVLRRMLMISLTLISLIILITGLKVIFIYI